MEGNELYWQNHHFSSPATSSNSGHEKPLLRQNHSYSFCQLLAIFFLFLFFLNLCAAYKYHSHKEFLRDIQQIVIKVSSTRQHHYVLQEFSMDSVTVSKNILRRTLYELSKNCSMSHPKEFLRESVKNLLRVIYLFQLTDNN